MPLTMKLWTRPPRPRHGGAGRSGNPDTDTMEKKTAHAARRTLFALAAALAVLPQGCRAQEKKNAQRMEDKKVLVAYFSRTGENYGVGNITKGNTCIVAEAVARKTGGDLFEIVPVQGYPASYDKCTEVAKKERNAAARPAVKGDARVEDYDTVFIGYPNWWGDAPMPVYTFIEKHHWTGKTVIPFCTHEGSGLSNAAQIKAACKGATVLKGLAVYGHTAQKSPAEAESAVDKWLSSLAL